MNKLKSKFGDKRMIMKGLSILWVLGLIVITTATHLILDPDKFTFNTWITKTVMMIAISVFGIIMGESIGDDAQKKKENGLYQASLKAFSEIHNAIQEIATYFPDFLLWYQDLETKRKCIKYLTNKGIAEARAIVENLEYLKEDEKYKLLLNKPIMLPNNVIVRRKDEEAIGYIERVIKGKIIVRAYDSSYYLNAFENHTSASELEVGKYIDRDIANNKKINRVMKIGWSILVSIVWATLTVQDFMKANDVSAWVDLISRISTLMTCIYSGMTTSITDVKLQARKIKNKANILTTFKQSYDRKEFNPQSYEEKAREEYNAYLKQQEEKDQEIKEDNSQIELKEESKGELEWQI